ncbi:MAG TPA: alpha/beta hydrolase [Candidatus Sulfotelmatobacter sp.]|nr:alpha/beta hydrolase [Candidatus Sulfotelmatobacter sp.]
MPTLATFVVAALVAITSLQVQAQSVTSSNQPARQPGSFVPVENGQIYYEECGSGTPTVVLIHDGIAHSAVWDQVWPAFCGKFHTIRYDRRGYGKSPASTTWYYETDDLATLLRYLKVPRAVIVGSSHGGELSIDFTLAHPDVVQELVLVGAVVSGFPYSDHFLNRGMENSKPLEKNDVKAAIANWSKDKYVLAPGHDAAQKKLLEILSASPTDLNHQDYARPTQPALPRLHDIHVPTLILTGDADIPDVHAHAGAIEAGIRGSRRVVLSDCGHLMYLERPEEFTKIVTGFIESNYPTN